MGEEESPKPSLNYKTFLRERAGPITDRYRKVADLGEGAFGDVWLVHQRICAGTPEEREGRLLAVKRVRKPNPALGLDEEGADSEEALEDFRVEVELMKTLDHPNICRLFAVSEDAKSLYLVMEHIQGAELFDRICQLGSFGEDDAVQVVRQVASALAYCHRSGVVHRDIKPENVMILDPDPEDEDAEGEGLSVKVIDFGFGCRILQGVRLKPKVGTFVYSAPEVLSGEPCDEKQDLWALGCVLFVLLSGDAPFFGGDCRSQIVQARFGFAGPVWAKISDGAKSLIRGLLVADPTQRLGATEMLTHPWLTLQRTPSNMESKSVLEHLHTLESFHKQSLFRHVCAGIFARQMDETMLHELHRTFCQVDEDEDGIISLAEFKRAIHESGLQSDEASAELLEMFKDADMDASGYIDYTEFVAACLDRKIELHEGACWAAFQVFDIDGNGLITFNELRKVLTSASMQGTFSQDTMQQLWKQLTCDEEARELCADNAALPSDLEGNVDFDHFLATLRGVRAAKRGGAAPAAAEAEPKPAAFGLPIGSRARGAVSAMGLPIAARAGQGGGLPIIGRRG